MARRQANRKVERGFIPLPREGIISYSVTIDGISIKDNMIKGDFTRAISPEIGSFKINLLNANGKYSDKYKGGEEVILKVDLGRTAEVVTVDTSTGGQVITLTEGERL